MCASCCAEFYIHGDVHVCRVLAGAACTAFNFSSSECGRSSRPLEMRMLAVRRVTRWRSKPISKEAMTLGTETDGSPQKEMERRVSTPRPVITLRHRVVCSRGKQSSGLGPMPCWVWPHRRSSDAGIGPSEPKHLPVSGDV